MYTGTTGMGGMVKRPHSPAKEPDLSALLARQTFICIFAVVAIIIIRLVSPDLNNTAGLVIRTLFTDAVDLSGVYQATGQAFTPDNAQKMAAWDTSNNMGDSVDAFNSRPDTVTSTAAAGVTPATASGSGASGVVTGGQAGAVGTTGAAGVVSADGALVDNSVLGFSEEANDATDAAVVDGVSMIRPVEGAMTSGFGNRIDPFTGEDDSHRGVDIEAPEGTTIVAAMTGEVVEAGKHSIYGNYIIIKNGKVSTLYGHCSKLMVQKGQQVKQGDSIALSGETGHAIGAHLHFEIMVDNQPVNPEEYFVF